MNDQTTEKREKTEQLWFRVDEKFKKDLEKWLEYHSNYNMSSLIRELLENKIYSDGSISEEISPIEKKIDLLDQGLEGMSKLLEKMVEFMENTRSNKNDVTGLRQYMGKDKE